VVLEGDGVNVAVIGTGRVGLVTGACLASIGHTVSCMDADRTRVAMLREGRAPFYEPDLDEMVAGGLARGALRFVDTVAEAVQGAAFAFICVGRPVVGRDDRSLSAVEDAARAVAKAAPQGLVVVVKSTVPPGTNRRVAQVVATERADLEFDVASNPEFLREGRAVEDTLRPDRLVVGASGERSLDALRRLYAPIIDAGCRLVETDPESAELAKLSSNAFLALKISYANGLARLAERTGADVADVAEILGSDPRIGRAFLGAGLGYGGYCLPKDVAMLEKTAERAGYDFGLLREVARINEEAVEAVVRTVEEVVWNLEGKRVTLLGAAFKPGTDDVRAAPSLVLARQLLDAGAEVAVWDPKAAKHAAEEVPELAISEDPYEAAVGASCAVVCTEWPELRELDLRHLAGGMAERVLVDARNALDAEALRAAGFRYVPIGRAAD
jgi:UDPglucose 6-dehydrogenase